MNKAHTHEVQFGEGTVSGHAGYGFAGSGLAAAPGVAGWLSLAAAPTFAAMALLTGVQSGGQPDMFCAAMHGASSLGGMTPMYVLMAAFHLSPWVKLISHRRRFVRHHA
jgi:hypothetical protein